MMVLFSRKTWPAGGVHQREETERNQSALITRVECCRRWLNPESESKKWSTYATPHSSIGEVGGYGSKEGLFQKDPGLVEGD